MCHLLRIKNSTSLSFLQCSEAFLIFLPDQYEEQRIFQIICTVDSELLSTVQFVVFLKTIALAVII